MPLGLGPFLDSIVTVILLIAAVLGGMHLYKKTVNPAPVAQAAHSTAPARTASSGEEILRDRYARGEIDRRQYLETLQNLKAQSIDGPPKVTGHLSADEIVRERYARGEINRAQFQEMIGDLGHNQP
jgi:putative membrane protein